MNDCGQEKQRKERRLALYRVAIALESEFLGRMIARFILTCWANEEIPVFDCRTIQEVSPRPLIDGCILEIKNRGEESKGIAPLGAKYIGKSKEIKQALKQMTLLCAKSARKNK